MCRELIYKKRKKNETKWERIETKEKLFGFRAVAFVFDELFIFKLYIRSFLR